MPDRLRIGLSLSLTGAYAAMGRQAEAAVRLFVADSNAAGGWRNAGRTYELALNCLDDQSDPTRCGEIYRELCSEDRADLVLGPYSSRMTRVAALIAERAGKLFINHGGAADHLYSHNYHMMVGVLSPGGDYMLGFARLLASLKFWRKRVAIVAPRTPFARAVAEGVEHALGERAARRRGVRVRLKYNRAFDPRSTPATLVPALIRNRINVLVSAGSFEHDLATIRLIIGSPLNIPVLACVAAGVRQFGEALGENSEGVVGPSQWEEETEGEPQVGPTSAEFVRRMRAANSAIPIDYPAAQAYAGLLVAQQAFEAAGGTDQHKMREALSDLRTSTFFGDFAIDRTTGRQVGHKPLLVQWHGGRKVIIRPEAHADTGTLEFPSGWRLILSSFQRPRITQRGGDAPRDVNDLE